jgi:transposase
MITNRPHSLEHVIMAVRLPDARELSDEVLEAFRLRALRGCELGFTEADVADLLGVCRETVSRWWSAYTQGGLQALPHDRTGRPRGSGRDLDDGQGQHLQGLLDAHRPEELGIAAPLWTRRAVQELIRRSYGLEMPLRTVGEYLQRWGYTPQKPRRKSRRQDPEEVRQWLAETYPALEARAAREGADIYWCDELGIGPDEYRGRGYARPGQPPAKVVSGDRRRVNAVSAINNRGDAHFLTFTGALDTAVFLTFLEGLLAAVGKKVFLILDSLRAHDNAEVQAWVAARRDRIELIPLPKYAPERNVVEYLNNDVKAEVNAQGLPENQERLHSNLDGFLHKLAFWPKRIISYFRHPAVQYAAANAV